MVLIIKNTASTSVANTLYLTASQQTAQPYFQVELVHMTTGAVKRIRTGTGAITITTRFDTWSFTANPVESYDPVTGDNVNLSGPNWPEGFIQFYVYGVADASDNTEQDRSTAAETGLGYIVTGAGGDFLLLESSTAEDVAILTTEANQLILLEQSTLIADPYGESHYETYQEEFAAPVYYE